MEIEFMKKADLEYLELGHVSRIFHKFLKILFRFFNDLHLNFHAFRYRKKTSKSFM